MLVNVCDLSTEMSPFKVRHATDECDETVVEKKKRKRKKNTIVARYASVLT